MFQKITQTIELREKDLSPHLRVRYFTRCLNPTGPLLQTNKCDGLKVGQLVEFDIEVELLSCPISKDEWQSRFYIYPVGVNENLTVQVEMLCDCGCSKPEVRFSFEHAKMSVDSYIRKRGVVFAEYGTALRQVFLPWNVQVRYL